MALASELIEVEGLWLRVSTHWSGQGSGRPLLLLNGIGASFELLEPFRRALAGTETIAIDMPGTGGSQTPRLPRSLCGLAHLVAKALDVIGYHEVDVLGVSWGGALAQEFARRHLERVRRLVLAATTSGWTSIPGHPRALWALATPRRYYSRSYFERVAPIIYGGAARSNPRLLQEHGHLRFIRPPSLRGYLWQLLAPTGWTSLPFLPTIDRPALVLAADDDPIVPLVNAKLIARLLPHARLHVIPNGGHLFLVTHAEQIAPIVERFLGDVAALTE